MIEFSALGEAVLEEPDQRRQQQPGAAGAGGDANFVVRGKWLQFDCPHCVRPMRLIAEDAGGLVDCAHCGLELIAPDPAIGRGAQLSRASEGKIGQIARCDPHQLRRGARHQPDPIEAPPIYGEEVGEEEGKLDPNHSLARFGEGSPGGRKRAVKALDPDAIGRAFRRREVIAEQVMAATDNDWAPLGSERRSFGHSRQDQRGFWIALGVAAAIMIGVVAMVVREAGRSDAIFDESQLSQIQAAQKRQNSSFQASFEAAQRALASPTWEALMPQVRQPQRVAPLMRAYYAEIPYEAIELTKFHAPVEVSVGGLTMHEMKVTDPSGTVRMLVVENSAAGARLDWELSFDLAGHDWGRFLEQRPADPQTLRVVAARSSVDDRYFEDAGMSRDEAIGIRLWQGSADSYFAILPKSGELAKAMSTLLEWDKGRKIIIDASFDPESKINERLRIDGFVQTGWVIE